MDNQNVTHAQKYKVYKSAHNRSTTGCFHWLDVAKGIGIVLVVLAHSIFPFVQQIDYFHMAMFFVIAGVTFTHKPIAVFLIGKINRIFIPWVFWMVLSSVISLLPHGYGGVFNGSLWFLQNIFVALVIVYLLGYAKGLWQFVIFLILIYLSYFLVNEESIRKLIPFGIPLAMISAQFIMLGNLLFNYVLYKNLPKTLTFTLALFSLILYGIICNYLMSKGVEGSYVSLTLFRQNFAGSYLACLSGSLMVLFASMLIHRNKYIEWLGRNSLVIMCVHFPFCMYLDGHLVKLSFFTTQFNKLLIAGIEWIFVLSISSALCIACKKFIPSLTGYKPLIKF